MRYPMIIIASLVGAPTVALDLKPLETYALNRPASLDYDPVLCGLWIANEGPEAILMTTTGEELRRIRSDMSRIKAISLEGDHLLVADGFGSFQRLSKEGVALAAPFRARLDWADTEGIAIDDQGNIITVEDDPEYLSWLTPEGDVIRRIDTMTLSPPLSEAQGIARDPRTGHLLIVDDMEGTNSLYEFSAEGMLLGTQSLYEFGLDPEGIAIRPGSDEVFIAFDEGARIVSFSYTPTLPEGHAPLRPGADCMMF